mmetsp:Transcript_94970/g.268254  ORF Transcript_94970/g.268254 Transcript_94970/m.268254 type:complete len:212 (+) Transcript_94970:659-1294(+)
MNSLTAEAECNAVLRVARATWICSFFSWDPSLSVRLTSSFAAARGCPVSRLCSDLARRAPAADAIMSGERRDHEVTTVGLSSCAPVNLTGVESSTVSVKADSSSFAKLTSRSLATSFEASLCLRGSLGLDGLDEKVATSPDRALPSVATLCSIEAFDGCRRSSLIRGARLWFFGSSKADTGPRACMKLSIRGAPPYFSKSSPPNCGNVTSA